MLIPKQRVAVTSGSEWCWRLHPADFTERHRGAAHHLLPDGVRAARAVSHPAGGSPLPSTPLLCWALSLTVGNAERSLNFALSIYSWSALKVRVFIRVFEEFTQKQLILQPDHSNCILSKLWVLTEMKSLRLCLILCSVLKKTANCSCKIFTNAQQPVLLLLFTHDCCALPFVVGLSR